MLEISMLKAKGQKPKAKLKLSSGNMRHAKYELMILRNLHWTNQMIYVLKNVHNKNLHEIVTEIGVKP